jgi:hypothetical protein
MNSSEFVGNVFIKDGTPLPSSSHFDFADCGSWKKLMHVDSYTVELMALRSGWHFSYIITAVKGSAFGLTQHSAIDGAMKRVIEAVSRFSFNSLEITEVTFHKTLVVHHVDVVANPRHLWPNPFLHDLDPHCYSNTLGNFKPIFCKEADLPSEIQDI